MELDVDLIRQDFPILSTKMNGKPLAYLDNAATSQKPVEVIDAINEYYKTYNANIHRGIYKISEEATEAYIKSKEKVAKFINAGSYRQIIYYRSTTEAINILARSWGEQNLEKGDHVLLSEMEHHSNLVPWLMLAKRKGIVIDYIKLKDKKTLDEESLKEKLELKPKLVAFTHVSNVLGTINEAKHIIELAHKAGATTLLDAAQSAPHLPLDVSELDCDFMAFSAHKMLGPAGIGVLYGKEDLLEKMEPVLGGGDMIRSVEFYSCTWNELPWKFEAGTQNIEGAIGFGAAIDYLQKIGMDKIRAHEKELTRYALERLEEENVEVFGPEKDDLQHKAGVISFAVKGIHAHDMAQVFDSEGIAIRSGHHCAMPLVNEVLGEVAVARMSFYLYNKKDEVDRAIEAIKKARKLFNK
ncbi:MAG: aminotransferase class V-fold PLP-dependent enzyme [Candidatus Micrarchaeia archaeon]